MEGTELRTINGLPVGAIVEVEPVKSWKRVVEWDFSILEGGLEECDCPVRDGSLMARN